MPISIFPEGRRSRRQTQHSQRSRPQLVEQDPCVACGSANVHRSRARNLFERIRKRHTASRPFHCHDCGWRGWLRPLQSCGVASVAARVDQSVDLTSLDGMFGEESHRKAQDPDGDPCDS